MIVTCEHGGNAVPTRWRKLFAARRALLLGHRGWDPGALELAREMPGPLHFSKTTRLLVDLNRSLGHPRLFSEVTRPLPAAERARILALHYHPYRQAVEQAVAESGPLLHLSVHSFTPVLEGAVRSMDVGLLYDPTRAGERRFCDRWIRKIRQAAPGLVVRRNAPYRGVSDGLVTHLRRRFPASRYRGIELEVNQRHPLAGGARWRELRRVLVATFRASLLPERR